MSRLAVLLSCFLACACSLSGAGTAVSADANASLPGPRLILKFKPATLSCTSADVERLASDTGLPLRLLRPMSGDGCVLILAPSMQTQAALSRLSQHPAIEWAEADPVMRPNQQVNKP